VRRRCDPGPGSRTASGGGDMMISRATEERERARGQKIAKCGKKVCGDEKLLCVARERERERGLKF
jgi:hypothetical protein